MKRFLTRLLLFSIPLLLYPVFLWVFNRLTFPSGEDVWYLWGDSQMQGNVDLDLLRKHTRLRFYSSAQQGSGIYDFLVFTEMVPEYSRVIITISRTVLLRRPAKDKSTTTINPKSLCLLSGNHYTPEAISRIILKNLKPHRIFSPFHSLHRNLDTLKITEPMSAFQAIYSSKPSYFEDKERLYFIGIHRLLEKNCTIIALVFPFHPILEQIEQNSPYLADLAQFDKKMAACFSERVIIPVGSRPNVFADLTHLNERGADSLSKKLIPYLNVTKGSFLVKIVLMPE